MLGSVLLFLFQQAVFLSFFRNLSLTGFASEHYVLCSVICAFWRFHGIPRSLKFAITCKFDHYVV